ncbi:MAG: NAD-dependent succinate-semialdehyde dehydrogenase [Bacteroidetes bacterium]|nr:NAD-dependent succinate-semialdehyde dehydrogenase [Bacteroidota bacterium]
MKTINPTTEEELADYPSISLSDIHDLIHQANVAQKSWAEVDVSDRCNPVRQLGRLLQNHQQELAYLMAQEMGKPLAEGQAEIEKCVMLCEHYAQHGPKYLAPQEHTYPDLNARVIHQPLGVVLAIMPWNFPFWQVFRCAIPALIAGNAVLLKHAPNVLGCGERIAELMQEANFPPSVFQHVIISVSEVQHVIEHPLVRSVSLTGSERAGRAVAEQAGRHLTPTVLELGGNDAYLLLHDADLDAAVEAVVASRMRNNGQSCIGAKRCVVHTDIHDEFVTRILERLSMLKVGNPLEPDTDLGPIAREDLRAQLHQQVLKSMEQGGRCLTGGQLPQRSGWFYPPTLLTEVVPGMPAFDEELFGPVISVVSFQTEEDGIRLANQSMFGLGGAIFSRDVDRARLIAEQHLEAGSVAINGFVRSDPRVPFGGIKNSGYGRELGRVGMLEFVNIKTVTLG